MIVIKIELHSAVTKHVTLLGKMHIANDGTGTSDVGNYTGSVLRKPDFKNVTRDGKVTGHRRKALTVWHLLGKMLKEMGYVAI